MQTFASTIAVAASLKMEAPLELLGNVITRSLSDPDNNNTFEALWKRFDELLRGVTVKLDSGNQTSIVTSKTRDIRYTTNMLISYVYVRRRIEKFFGNIQALNVLI